MQRPSSHPDSRRHALRLIAGTIVLSALPLKLSADADLPHLTAANPSAASLGYTEDSASVDEKKYPKHDATQRCAGCKYFQAGAGAQYAPCQLYPGNAVNANGWCAGYVSR